MKKIVRNFMSGLFLFYGLVLHSPPVSAATATAESCSGVAKQEAKREFQLGAGDVIGVFVWKWPDLSRSMPIGPDGSISYPLIGEIRSVGKTLDELADIIKSRLQRHVRDPQVTVTLDQVNSFRIFVNGEVLQPGVFKLSGATTVVQAIAMAGGFTPFASRENVLVYRRGASESQRIEFNYDAFIEGHGCVRDVPLKRGDTVIVR